MSITSLGLSTGDLFTRQQAIAAGVTGRSLAAMVASGAIARLAPGVYRAGAPEAPDPRALSIAMQATIKLDSAAAWLGGDLPTAPSLTDLTAPRSRGRRADCVPGVRLHRADLAPADRLVVRGASVTAPVRTILDEARSKPLLEAVAIGDSLCRVCHIEVAEVQSAAAALPYAPGRRDAVAVAALLDALAESVFESFTRVRAIMAGFPVPVSQYNVVDLLGRWIARVDFAWPELRVILECDGYEFHGDREQFERDRRRWTALTRAGWRVAVVTWRDLMGDPQYRLDVLADYLV